MRTRIKNIFKMFIIMMPVLLIIFTSPSWALNDPTHNAINEYIAQNIFTFETGKVFSLDDYLKTQLGMSNGKDTFLNNKKVFNIIGDGGTSEDNSYRYLNHFYNPLTKQGYSYGPISLFFSLFGYYPMPSLNWALMPTSTQNMDGSYSWNDVRYNYFMALTATAQADRTNYFAQTFRGLGQLMHLVEDISVPAHTRNDSHGLGDGYENWAEKYVKPDPQNPSTLWVAFDPKNPVSFQPSNSVFFQPSDSVTVSNLFDTNHYTGSNPNPAVTLQNNIGLSEYTNANFFSDGTIYSTNDLPFPLIDITQTDQRSYTGPSGTYNRQYYLKNGYLLAAVGYYDYWRLQIPTDPNVDVPIIATLDDNVYSDYAQLLISRAIGYSSQVLSYFFRAKMDLVQDQPPSGSYVIQNDSNEKMEGEFHLYYDNTSDVRVEIQNNDFPILSMVIESNSKSTSINFTAPTDAINPGEYILVFRGNMGEETSAVAGKVIQQPRLLVTTEPGSIALGDVEEKIANYNVTLDATIAYLNGQVQYWLDMYNYYISIIPIDPNAGMHAAEALQASQAFGLQRDQLVEEKLHWAQFLAGIKDIANAPTRFIGGSAATDFTGKFSELAAHYYAAYLDKSVPPTWSTIPAVAKEHTFLTGPGVGGNPVIFLMYKTKAGIVRDSQETSIICRNFYFSAPYILNPELTININGNLWIKGPQGSLSQETNNVFSLDTLYHVEVWMSATVIDGNNFPSWNHTLTMNMKLFSFDFKVKKE